MSIAEKTCRTCGKTYDDGTTLCPIYNPPEYEVEINMAIEEFLVWDLNIQENDGLPQKICLKCFDSFCQIHNFRLMCVEAQANFGEMCTGLDIIIKDESDFEFDEHQTVIVQERFTFPGDALLKMSNEDTNENGVIEENPYENNEDLKNIVVEENETENEKEPLAAGLNNIIINQNEDPEYDPNDLIIKDHRCDYCMYFVSFDDPDELNSHYNELHSGNYPYHCPNCSQSFDKASKQKSHARSHFSSIPKECKHCGKRFRSDNRMLAEHIAYFHIEKDRYCKVCKLTFEKTTLKNYEYHMMWHNESKLRKCKFCDKKFIQLPHLTAHERTHASDCAFKCNQCNVGFKNEFMHKKHMQMHEKNELVQCSKCPNNKKYYTLIGINLHIQKTHAPHKEAPVCEICNITFYYPHDLRFHNHKKHGIPLPPKQKKRTGRPNRSPRSCSKANRTTQKREHIKPFQCDKCDEAYVLEVQLLRHMKKHDEHRPHKCKLCNKTFKRDAHLKIHESNIHFHKKPFKCTMCDAAFIQRSTLADHIAINHENIRNHECEVCHKKFGTQQILKAHMVLHSDERPFKCKLCDKSFKLQMVLRSHMSLHYKKEGFHKASLAAANKAVESDLFEVTPKQESNL